MVISEKRAIVVGDVMVLRPEIRQSIVMHSRVGRSVMLQELRTMIMGIAQG